jgi:hypothetical protein
MFRNYLKVAWRNLSRQTFTTIINVSCLSIGISACLVIYLVTHFEFTFDKFHPDGDRIYRVVLNIDDPHYGKSYRSQIPYAAALQIQRAFTGVEHTANFFSYGAKVTVPRQDSSSGRFAERYPSKTIIANSSYFTIFPYLWLYGNASTALEQPFRIVLTESRARQYFGSLPIDRVLGKELVYDDSLRLIISGVVKDWSGHSDLDFQEFISLPTIQASFLRNLSDLKQANRPDWTLPDYTQNFVKLAKGTTPAQFELQAARMVKEHMVSKNDPFTVQIRLQPLSTIHFDGRYTDFYSRQAHLSSLYLLMAIAGFILLIAAINIINLSTAQSIRRSKEIGIRKVLGSGRIRLITQFLSETFVLTCMAVLCSLLIARPVLYLIRDFIPAGVAVDLFDGFTWIFLLGTILVTSLLAGLYPSLVLSAYSPLRTLQARGAARQKGYFRQGLIVFQFTISLLFIIGTIVIGNQTRYLLNKDLGFAKDAIVSIGTSDNYATSKRNILAEKVRQLPGVDMVSACWIAPVLNYNQPEGSFIQLINSNNKVECSERTGDQFYVPLFGLKLLAGRNFLPPQDDTMNFVPNLVPYDFSFPKKRTEILINATCARELGFKTPQEAIGHFVRTPAPNLDAISGPIVGVVADFHAQSLFSPIRPVYIYGTKNLWRGGIQVKLSTQANSNATIHSTLQAIEKSWKEVYPEEAFTYRFLDETIADMYVRQRMTARITTAAMIVAIFISCMGLYALVTFSAEQRTKEIGIRKVLGASVQGIVGMLSKDFLLLVSLSILLASPIAWYFLHRWLQDFAFRIPISWWIFVLSGAGAMALALITISFKAIKAAIANPVKSLRTE